MFSLFAAKTETRTSFFDYRRTKTVLVASVLFLGLVPTILHKFLGVNLSLADIRVPGAFPRGLIVHALLEWSAVAVAAVSAALAFIHFGLRRDPLTLIIGIALITSGLMDAFHVLAATRLVHDVSGSSDFIPFTWALCRTMNGVIFLSGAVLLTVFKFKDSSYGSWTAVWAFGVSFVVLSYFSIDAVTEVHLLPQTLYPGDPVTRPFDVLPLILFLLMIPFVFRLHKNYNTPFTFAIAVSMAPQIATQLYMVLGSSVLFDYGFNAAHMLKVLAYLTLFSGLCLEFARTLRQEEGYLKALRVERNNLDLALHVAELGIWDMDLRTDYLFWDDKVHEIFEVSKEDFNNTYQCFADFIHEADLDKVNSSFFRAVDDPSYVYETNLRIETPSGLKYLHTRGEVYRDSEGKAVRVIGVVWDRTKEAVRDLRVAELGEQIEFLAHNINGAFWIQDLERNVPEYISQGYERIFGHSDEIFYSEDHDTKWSWLDMVHPDDRAEAAVEANLMDRHGKPLDYEFRMVDMTGETRWLHLRGQERIDEHGHRKFVGITEDITNRKVAELSVDEERKKFHAVVECMPSGLLTVDRTGVIRMVNPILCEMFGYSPDEMTGQKVEMLLPHRFRSSHPEKRGGFFSNPEPVLLASRDLDKDFYGLRKDGSEFALEIGINLLSVAGEQFALGAIADVTNLKLAEQALRDSERKNRAYLEYSPMCTKILDPDFNLQYMSAAGIGWLGISDISEYYGKPYPFSFYPESFRNEMTSNLKRAVAEDEVITQEAPVTDINGNEVWYHSTIVPVIDDDGNIEYIIVVSSDVTVRVAAEAALRRSNEDLEQFAYIASHDLREPLRMVSNYTSLLRSRYGATLEEDAHEYLDFIKDGVDRVQLLVSDLLEFSRAGRSLDDKISNARSDAVEALHYLEKAIDESGADITLNMPAEVLVRCTHLVRVFQNLFSNAIKFRELGATPHINIDCKDSPTNPYMFQFSVSDDGIGISEEHKAKIFSAFKRLHTYDKYPGSGIGLAVCKRIVEAQGGSIWVESEKGVGTTFYFTLPRVVEIPKLLGEGVLH